MHWLFVVLHHPCNIVEIRCSYFPLTFCQHSICTYLQNWLYHPQALWESQISTRSWDLHEYLWGYPSLLCVSANIFLVYSAFCILYAVETQRITAGSKDQLCSYSMIYHDIKAFLLSMLQVLTLLEWVILSVWLNSLGYYHPTVFCWCYG